MAKNNGIESGSTDCGGDSLLRPLLDSSLDPAFWVPKRLGAISYWWGHVPFAHLLVTSIRPKVVVELGTFNGVSFAAFCEAMRRQGIPGRCYAVDTWSDVEHYGMHDDSTFLELGAYCRTHFGGLAELVRSTFRDALASFDDDSIDLLHIDGPHTYESAKEEFESWIPKLSRNAVVLIHDINVRDVGFGVWRLWDELKVRYPSFEFLHACGLGAIATGSCAPRLITDLQKLRPEEAYTLQERFASLGAHWETMDRHNRSAASSAKGREPQVSDQ